MYKTTIENQFFKSKTNKKQTSDKKHYTTETKHVPDSDDQNNNKNKYCNNLTKGEH